MITSKISIAQNATDTYLTEFHNDRNYSIDFGRAYCGGKFDVPENEMIHLESLVDYKSSTCSITQYAKDLQRILLASNYYKINGDSLMLSGNGEINLIRSMDCAGGGATGDGTVACIKNIVYIHMIIKWPDGSDVLLTSSTLIRLSDGKTIHSSNYLPRQPDWPTNGYRLIDDSYRKDFAGKKVEVEYQGFINDKMIVKSAFTITADCCHVSMVSGNLDIVVN